MESLKTMRFIVLGVLLLLLVGLLWIWWWHRGTGHQSASPSTPPSLTFLPSPNPVDNPILTQAQHAVDTIQPNAGDVLIHSALQAREQLLDQGRYGVDPEQVRAINQSLWTAATTYRYGLGPQDAGQSTPAAKAIYHYLSRSPSVDAVTRADAAAELHIIQQEERNHDAYNDFMNQFEQRQYQPPAPLLTNVPRIVRALEQYDAPAVVNHPTVINPTVIIPAVIQQQPTTQLVARSDAQNVHDSGLVASMRASLAKLRQGTRDVPQDLSEIRQALPARSRAQNVLDRMASNHQPLSAYGMTESEILSAVWGRIQDPINQDRRTDLIASLQGSLEDCYEGSRGEVVCATGRTARAVQSLEQIDRRDLVELQPKWAMDQEIQNTGAHVYQRVLKECSPDEQHACTLLEEDATPAQIRQQQEVKQRYSDALRGQLTDEYRDVLSPEQIESRVDSLASLV